LIPMSTWPLPGPGRRCPRPVLQIGTGAAARTTGPCRPTGRRATVRGRSLAKQGACGSGKSLEELAKAGMSDDKLTTAVFEAVMEELAEQKG
jgi:hypothetical protein